MRFQASKRLLRLQHRPFDICSLLFPVLHSWGGHRSPKLPGHPLWLFQGLEGKWQSSWLRPELTESSLHTEAVHDLVSPAPCQAWLWVGTPTHCQQLEKMTKGKQERYVEAGCPDALGSQGGQGILSEISAVQEIEAKEQRPWDHLTEPLPLDSRRLPFYEQEDRSKGRGRCTDLVFS